MRYNLLILLFILFLAVVSMEEQEDPSYVILGVSGGLQDGFPDHIKMDYHAGQHDEVQAILLGRALVRGVKSYLDVMQPGWRQYVPAGHEQPLINSVVFVTGCHEHANQYWIYAVDSRQAVTILNNEPRFLGITPDTGLVDLEAAETSDAVKGFARHEIKRQGKIDENVVAIPIVVATWYHESFVPSPPVQILEDYNVTNFPESLALWANVNDSDRTVGCDNDETQECASSQEILVAQKRYWDGIRRAVRSAEANRPSVEEWRANGPPFDCQKPTRLGVSPDQARINYSFEANELVHIMDQAGHTLNLKTAKLHPKD
jgi:hypothetical protein